MAGAPQARGRDLGGRGSGGGDRLSAIRGAKAAKVAGVNGVVPDISGAKPGRETQVPPWHPGILMTLSMPSPGPQSSRSEEHTSELQSLMRISYAVFCLKKKKKSKKTNNKYRKTNKSRKRNRIKKKSIQT